MNNLCDQVRFRSSSILPAFCVLAMAVTSACTTAPGKSVMGSTADGFQRQIYAGAGVGSSRLDPDTSTFPQYDVNDRVGGAAHLNVGADLTKTFSVEAHITNLGSAGLSPSGPADGSSSAGRVDYYMSGASALIYAGGDRSNNGRRGITGFARLGLVGVTDTPEGAQNTFARDVDSSPLLVGAGVEYANKNGMGLRAEIMANDSDILYGQLGFTYRLRHPQGGPKWLAKSELESELPVIDAPSSNEDLPFLPEPEIAAATAPALAASPIDTDGNAQSDGFTAIDDVVNFASNSAELTEAARATLDAVADQITDHSGTGLQLSAHTDSSGSAQYNRALADRRAEAVTTYLNSKGVEWQAIAVEIKGEAAPAAKNTNASGRYTNRRVEIRSVDIAQ